jgi:hypothetical protein
MFVEILKKKKKNKGSHTNKPTPTYRRRRSFNLSKSSRLPVFQNEQAAIDLTNCQLPRIKFFKLDNI